MRRTLHLAPLALVAALAAPALAGEPDLAALRAAAKATPKEAAPSLALCKALRRAGHFADAVQECQRGASLGAARKAGLHLALAREAALAKLDLHDIPGALKICDAIGRANAPSEVCRAEVFLAQNRAGEALPLAKKALAAEPDLYEARAAEGRSFALQGKVAEAEEALRKAAKDAPGRPDAHRWLGVFLLNQGRRDEGIAALEQATLADPGDPEILLALGEARAATKEGQAALLRAVKIRPAFAEAHAVLARSSLELGDLQTAEAAAVEAVRLDPTSTDAHVVLAEVRIQEARWDDAVKEAEAAKRLVPNSARAERILADAHAGKGEIDLAAAAYQRAFGFDPRDPTPLLRAGEACTRGGRPTTARGFADKLTGDFPRWAPGWILLGDLLAKGDADRARAAYKAALDGEGAIDRDAVTKKLATLQTRK